MYWGGGNPFHPPSESARDCAARWAAWTPWWLHDHVLDSDGPHADIVVPSTTAFEREDFSGSRNDPLLVAMRALTAPYADARDDYTTSPNWRSVWDSVSSSPKAAPRASGWPICTRYGRRKSDFAVSRFDQFWADGFVRYRSRMA